MIQPYEVEIRLGKVGEPGTRLVTRTEHAYSVQDAVAQAAYNVLADEPGKDIHLVHIGPPQEAILRATDALAEAIRSRRKALGGVGSSKGAA